MKYVLGTVPFLAFVNARMGFTEGVPRCDAGGDPLWLGSDWQGMGWTTSLCAPPLVTANAANVPNPTLWAMGVLPEYEHLVPEEVTLVPADQVTLYVPPNPDE